MPISNAFPVLNGVAPSWADIAVRIRPNGGPLIQTDGIAAINTSQSVEIGEQRGISGGRVMKRTTGARSTEASMTFYRDGWLTLIQGLSLIAPRRGNQRLVSLVPFLVEVQYSPVGSVAISMFRLKGCRLIGETDNAAEGSEASQIEAPLSVLEKVHVLPTGEEVSFL